MALIRLRIELGAGAEYLTPKVIHGALSAMLRGDALSDAAHAGDAPPVFSPWLVGRTLRVGFLSDGPAGRVWRALDGGSLPTVPPVPVLGVSVEAGHPWTALIPAEETNRPIWVEVRFVSPVSFRHTGTDLPLPVPDLILASLARSWRAYADVPLPGDPAGVSLVSIRGESVVHELGQAGLARIGFTGEARYCIEVGRGQKAARALFSLASFAGVGQKAAWGMGRIFAREQVLRLRSVWAG